MVANGRLKDVIEKIGGQLPSRSLGGLVDAFVSPCDCFDLFLPSLSRFSRQTKTKAGVADQIKPCNRSILPAILAPGLVRALWDCVSRFQNMEIAFSRVGLTLQISLLEERRR